MIVYIERNSPLGLLLAASDKGLTGLYFDQHRYFDGPARWRHDDADTVLRHAWRQLEEYFGGERGAFDVSLDLRGTEFQQQVWKALCNLSFGTTASYQSIAATVARPAAVRAVGTAIGRNPVSIIVPCHRVLGSSGALCGYAGGLQRKVYLLRLEQTARQDRVFKSA